MADSAIARDVNCLLDPSVSVRKAALLRLEHGVRARGEEEIQELGSDAVIKAILRRFADPSEKCRCLAVSILLSLLEIIPGCVVSLLPYILPVVSERLPLRSLPDEVEFGTKVGQEALLEPSEEVRLLLVRLLTSLLNHAPRLIHPFASEVASIIMVTATDSYPEVLMETMTLLERFTDTMDQKIKPIAKQLVSVILRLLVHNRYKVRVAALRAVHRLVLCGAHESIYDLTAYQDPNLVPIKAFYHPYTKTQYLALLATDKSVAVRKELLWVIASWLMKLDERKQHEVRLVPYVISGFNDSDKEVQALAFQLMEEIGRQYESENENEVRDMKQYFQESTENILIGSEALPPVFKHRPCLGARILVRNCFSVLLYAIDADLHAWTSGTKELSSRFLYTVLIFVEENATMHLEPLCNLFIKACGDLVVQKAILECAKVVGFFVDPSAYLPIILPHLSGELSGQSTIQNAGRTLKILSSFLAGTPSSLLAKHPPDICSSLTEQDLLTSIDSDVNSGIVLSCKAMVAASCEDELALLWIILHAISAAEFSRKPSEMAESVLRDLARASRRESSDKLLADHADSILSMLPDPEFWIMRSLQPFIFRRLLIAGAACGNEILNGLLLPILSGGTGCIAESVRETILSTLGHLEHDINLKLLVDAKTKLSQTEDL
ncbi:dynein assembly factor 5, axonemal-like [Selaginella moellendorffii]|uniref:dynein assembly factor 5, axonemal-like n=1 Tax=Selaginella moellendorffii TaxID=88036 RepID=UPI000D1CC454|nr:dynein assembly factor 5, axonemal-like [Selaginella moellendorffii]|eukprot:XP_024523068.1 dynein assembly factor 5, axonemal-like [Selaginella moellendorffii]